MSDEAGNTLEKLDEFSWARLRVIGARLTPTLARICGDGDYLSASRLLGPLILPVALLAGFFLGYTHFAYDPADRPLYLYSFPTLLILVALSQHGAAVGFAAWSGFAVGELLYGFFGKYHSEKLLGVLGGWGLLIAVLWILVVGAPLATRQLGRAIQGKLKPKWRTLQTAVVLGAVFSASQNPFKTLSIT